MPPQLLEISVLVAAGAVIVLVPLLILLLAARIRTAAHQSTQVALTQAAQQHERTLAEFTREHERSLAEVTRQHERAFAELAREHRRIAQEFGTFSQKRQEVYARLYARYRRATHDLAAALTGPEPDFQKFSRDDLLRYLQNRKIREREATDAIGSMDRGDFFAMGKLMSKLHWRVTLRDANAAFERASRYEALNELYLSEAVRDAVSNVRRNVEVLLVSLTREQERGAQARLAKQDELHSAVESLLHAMRDDLRAGGGNGQPKPRPRPEVDRTASVAALPSHAELADRAPATTAAEGGEMRAG